MCHTEESEFYPSVCGEPQRDARVLEALCLVLGLQSLQWISSGLNSESSSLSLGISRIIKTPQFSYALDGSINQFPLSREQFMTTNSKQVMRQQCHFLQYHLQRNAEIYVQGCSLKHCLKKTGKDPNVPVKQIMEPPYNGPLCSCEKRIS